MNRSAIASSGLLDRIVAAKRTEVAGLSPRRAELRSKAADAPPAPGFAAALRGGGTLALIAEIKRKSPSAGAIAAVADPRVVAASYQQAGARALSVLTDAEFFGGSLADLESVCATCPLPVLRKDFTIDEVQIHEARAAGAAAVLLIVRILEDDQLRSLREAAESAGMAALVEVHDEAELERAVASGGQIIGVNSRDLDTLTIDLTRAAALVARVPKERIAVAESGIRTASDATLMAGHGAHAVLVGEALMKQGVDGTGAAAIAAIPRQTVVR